MRNKRAREFNVVIKRDTEGYYVASFPARPGCYTQAKALNKLVERIQEAVELCLEVRQGQIEPLEFIGVQKITVAQRQKGHESPAGK